MLKLQSRKDRYDQILVFKSHLFTKYPIAINVQPTNTVIYAWYSPLYKSIMPFNIAMKPKNQHIPIIKLTYIYLIRLPIRLSKKYQVKEINHEVAKKHCSPSTYNNLNVLIKVSIPFIYLVNHLFLLKYANTTNTANMMMTIICIGN